MNSPAMCLPIPNTHTTIRNYKPNILISDLSKINQIEQYSVRKISREPPL